MTNHSRAFCGSPILPNWPRPRSSTRLQKTSQRPASPSSAERLREPLQPTATSKRLRRSPAPRISMVFTPRSQEPRRAQSLKQSRTKSRAFSFVIPSRAKESIHRMKTRFRARLRNEPKFACPSSNLLRVLCVKSYYFRTVTSSTSRAFNKNRGNRTRQPSPADKPPRRAFATSIQLGKKSRREAPIMPASPHVAHARVRLQPSSARVRHKNAVPPGARISAAVAHCVCVPHHRHARPSRCQPRLFFRTIASECRLHKSDRPDTQR